VIKLIPGANTSSCKVYPLAPNKQSEMDAFIHENLSSGRIRPSKSPMASPVFFIKKKDGTLRLVQDYQVLNALMIKNRYPLPLISELVNQLHSAKYFTKLNVRWGNNNVQMKEGDEWKAAFCTNHGLFKPLVMFFGLTNSPSTFQTMMNDIFQDLIMEGVVCVYLDDILIFMKSIDTSPDWSSNDFANIISSSAMTNANSNEPALSTSALSFQKVRFAWIQSRWQE
jgi:hypothetical protein